MRTRDFEFNLRELAGSMGDFGTLLPLAIGYFLTTGIYHIIRKWGRGKKYLDRIIGRETPAQ